MYDKKILGLAEAERAAQAIIEEASKDPSSPCAVAISDCNGHLVYLARNGWSSVALCHHGN